MKQLRELLVDIVGNAALLGISILLVAFIIGMCNMAVQAALR
jgi:hypothetical protein